MAALSIAIATAAKKRGATSTNRRNQFLNELRMDEQSLVAEALDEVDEYRAHDRDTDIAFVQAIRSLYAGLTDDEQRRKCERVYTVWKTTEDGDDRIIERLDDQLDRTRVVMRSNNDVWLNGAVVPGGSKGAA